VGRNDSFTASPVSLAVYFTVEFGVGERNRTFTGFPTSLSSWRVCQFRHADVVELLVADWKFVELLVGRAGFEPAVNGV
jgi:hypothetical protein